MIEHTRAFLCMGQAPPRPDGRSMYSPLPYPTRCDAGSGLVSSSPSSLAGRFAASRAAISDLESLEEGLKFLPMSSKL